MLGPEVHSYTHTHEHTHKMCQRGIKIQHVELHIAEVEVQVCSLNTEHLENENTAEE